MGYTLKCNRTRRIGGARATPRSYFEWPQHERPRAGEGRHETCPYGG